MEKQIRDLAELLCADCANTSCKWYSGDSLCDAVLQQATTVINAGYRKQIKGKWIEDQTQVRGDGEIYDYCCSNCGYAAILDVHGNSTILTKYCSNCGATMLNA